MQHPTPAPADGTQLFLLGDEAVLFSEPRQELHALNTSAAVIWCLLDDGQSPSDIVIDLGARFSLSPAQAEAYVSGALQDWRLKGLLAGTEGPRREPPPPGWQPRPGLPSYPHDPAPFVAARAYRLLTTTFRVRFTAREHLSLVHPVMAHLEVPNGPAPTGPAPTGPAATGLDLLAADLGTVLYRDREPIDACVDDRSLVPMLYASMWMMALKAYPFSLNIHAGVVGTGDACILLPASPGSGKSSLTAALVYAGFDYFSDEVALLDSFDLSVPAFPQALCIKEPGIPAVAALFPHAMRLDLHLRGDGKRVAYLPPPSDRLPRAGERRPVRALIFPRYEPGAALACPSLAKTVALGRLLDQCTVIDQRLDASTVARLVAWIDSIECRDLVYGATADAVAAVTEVAETACRSIQRTSQTQTAK